ncbi:cytochrome c biogenesis protein ResB [Streptomyces sp. G-5]|uniref:cytochrome c biogenesis protein ResB n=1 Tax=Streptomyces TaxID=1883 RepID=UPI0021D3BA46|nr:cytochrome c biogenesis protein ResB [Streptomyces sp. G-5]MCU4750320.1 cytochrome c biogenesis protein ResB [Streptomyces sp. G-5]
MASDNLNDDREDRTRTDSPTRTDGRDGVDEAAATAGLSTAPAQDEEGPAPEPPGGGTAVPGSFGGVRGPGAAGTARWLGREAAGWTRWMWRQLTSMRVALILLFLLALGAIPGSLIPQSDVNALLVEQFKADNPTLGSLYERLQLFEVYSSVWFSAIYILLFISLIGCIVPRTWQFVGQLRGRPPRAPRRLDRMPAYTTWRTDAEPATVLDSAQRLLKRRWFRTAPAPDGGSVAAEKGYLREAGNLLFHISLIVLLVAFGTGQLFYSEGGKLVIQGDGFSNTLPQYDDFSSGSMFDVDHDLDQFGFTLNEFTAEFSREGPDLGTPTEFRADITYWLPDGTETDATVQPNNPVHIGDSKVYLLGHGFAPVITVTDGQGRTAFSGPVPFLPQDTGLTSTGVVKVTDYLDENGDPEQLGFQGFFNPSYAIDAERGPHSTFPDPDLPVLTLTAYHGDLGLDSGIPQNVYQLNTRKLEQFTSEDGEPFRFDLLPGESIDLPEGKGTLTYESYQRWATFQITTKAGNGWALAGSLAAVLGLAGSLMLQRRRVWVRATTDGAGRTVVELASLGRTESARIPHELADLAAALQPDAPLIPETSETSESSDAADSADSPESSESSGSSTTAKSPESSESSDDQGARA